MSIWHHHHHCGDQVKLCDLVSLVKTKLEQDGVIVREIRLNGSGASSGTILSLITSLITTSPWNMVRDKFTSYHHYFHPLVEEGDSTMQTGVSTLNISNRCNFFLCLTSHSSFLLSLPIINIFHFMRRQFFWTQPLFPHGALYYQPAHDNDNFQVLASECCDISYNDLDLIFTVDLPTQKHYERVSVEETEKQSF